jgi:hypothetical protein
MRFYWRVPGLSKKRNAGLTYSILSAISFKIVSFGMYPVGYQILFQNVIPSVSFSIWETKQNHRGLSVASTEDGER